MTYLTAMMTLMNAAEGKQDLKEGFIVATPPDQRKRGRVAKGTSNRFAATAATKKAEAKAESKAAAQREVADADDNTGSPAGMAAAPAAAAADSAPEAAAAAKVPASKRAKMRCGACHELGHRKNSKACSRAAAVQLDALAESIAPMAGSARPLKKHKAA